MPLAIKNDHGCANAISRVGELERELARLEAHKASAIASATKQTEDRAAPLQEERLALIERVGAYAAENRARLTDGLRSKTATFPTGDCGWRIGRGRVIVSSDPALKVKILNSLKKLGGGFIRTKEEIDASAIGKALADDPKAKVGRIEGIAYEPPSESFWVKPTGAELVDRPPAAA